MKCLERNKVKFYYCLYQGYTDILDSDGNPTLEKKITYSTPVEMYANISPARGEAEMTTFGTLLDYDKTIITDDMSCPIDENSILFIDKEPSTDAKGNYVYDYIVKRVAKSLNSISYAVQKVKK